MQGLSNICWAYAKLGAEVTKEVRNLLEALALEVVSQLTDSKSRQKFIPQNLANLVYGYAVLGADPGPVLLIAIAKESQRQLHAFGPQVHPRGFRVPLMLPDLKCVSRM